MSQNRTFSLRTAWCAFAFAGVMLAGCQPNVSERDLLPAEKIDIVEQASRSDTILIDARTPSAYRQGHIENAINLGIADISLESRKRADLVAAKTIIVYGQNPGDPLATGLALRLLEAGYDATRIYRGGVDAWTDNGGDLVTP